MKTHVFIQCCKSKNDVTARAKDVYCSSLFKYSLKYAHSLHPDTIHILSAKYGMIQPDAVISPYNVTLLDFSADERKRWSAIVLKEMLQSMDLKNDRFIFLCGKRYREHIIRFIRHYNIPLEHLGIGEQVQWLKRKVEQESR